MALATEELLHERYQIVRIIKSGGMGSVYEARDTKLADSPCAVKEIHEAARTGKDSEYILGRFKEEMKALALLDHPSIPKVRDYLTIDSTIFIVMGLVQGRSLEEELQETLESTGHPPAADHVVLDMIRLLDTLSYLHDQDPPVIHRDVKPANILRDKRSGAVKLVDFGLAKAVGGTQTQTVVGTLGYCSPEQMMGKAEQRSDIYAVGVTLCHLLTGSVPEMMLFEPRSPELPDVREGLVEIIEKSTQPRPSDRYATAQEMAADLQVWLHNGAFPGPTVVVPARVETPVKRDGLPSGRVAAPSGRIAPPSGRIEPPLYEAVPAQSGKWKTLALGAAIPLVLGGAFLFGQRSNPPAPVPSPVPVAKVVASPTPDLQRAARVVNRGTNLGKSFATMSSGYIVNVLKPKPTYATRSYARPTGYAAHSYSGGGYRPQQRTYSRPYSRPSYSSQGHASHGYSHRPAAAQPKRFLGVQYGTKRGERVLNSVINVFR